MEAAQSVFAESGYHAAAMDEIADRAHVSKPVLYQHFPGKLDLYLALIEQHTAELPELVRQAMASTSDNQERVAAAVATFFSFVEREDAAFRLVFESDLLGEPEVARRVDKMSAECADAVAKVIQEDTDLPPEKALLLGIATVGMSHTVARSWMQSRTVPRKEAETLVSSLVWRGLAGFPLHPDQADG
nr:TetR/AcrR family transcriptional regulator [Flexivirga oryzae]